MKLTNSQRKLDSQTGQKNELKKKEILEDKREILEPGVHQEEVKDIMEERNEMNELKEKNNSAKKENRQFASVDCGKTLNGKYSTNMEYEIAAVEKKENVDNDYICDTCKKPFPKKQALMSHLKIHDSKLRIAQSHFIGKIT